MKSDKLNLKQCKEKLIESFHQKSNVLALMRQLVNFIDDKLIALFLKHQLDKEDDFCLLALGSYGRRELLLHSDIDLLLLHEEAISPQRLQQAQAFIQDCWDSGLEISHQITTVQAAANLANQDVSVISSFMDLFLLRGRQSLMEELLHQTHSLHMWPSEDYFSAKLLEQKKRHRKYGETAYHLEPNIKHGRGGLRDIQMLLSIAKRHFHLKKLSDGIAYGFISDKEYEKLTQCQHFLWRVRFALHFLAGKAEERLSFDYQIKLAQYFGYENKNHSLAIEQFMKDYFKVIKTIRELNSILLQWFAERITQSSKQVLTPLDKDFQLANHYLEVRHPLVFRKHPSALLKLFFWIAKEPEIVGVRANTIRLIRESLYLINTRFKMSLENTALFMEIFKSKGVYNALKAMNRYGVLAHYLDSFAMVTGQMQYDLYHTYTVDQHTLFVIRNLSRFNKKSYKKQFPLCFEVMANLGKPEVLYLSALFHDIAKGRGGDHSELGALEAQYFAQNHQLSKESTQLLIWLVGNHLLMSQTAQRQDIYDPSTIKKFCQQLPFAHYLDYLYLLTVADICATNPNLWNSWKDSLLKELYRATKDALQKKQKSIDDRALLLKRKQQALKLLLEDGFSETSVQDLWSQFRDKYFLHESPEIIARHSKAILTSKTFPIVLIMTHHSQGGTEVFIYMPHQDNRFAITTTVLSNNHVTIQEASIMSSNNGFDLDTYIILDEQNQTLIENKRAEAIQQALILHLLEKNKLPAITQKRRSPTLLHFNVKTQVIYEDLSNQQTRLFLITTDRPGLLATLSRIFLVHDIHLHNAKIVTAGEKVEDMFYLSNAHNKALTEQEKESLRIQIIQEFN